MVLVGVVDSASGAVVVLFGIVGRSGYFLDAVTQGYALKSRAGPWAGIDPHFQRGNSGHFQQGWKCAENGVVDGEIRE